MLSFIRFCGTGYGAYWTGADPTSPSYVFLSRMYFWPSEAHNGYLDVVNDLGFVGLICLLGYLTVYVRQSLQLFRTDRPQGALYLALFFQQAMTNLSESCWFSPMGILPVVIMTLSTFTLARGLLDQQSSRALQSAVKAARHASQLDGLEKMIVLWVPINGDINLRSQSPSMFAP